MYSVTLSHVNFHNTKLNGINNKMSSGYANIIVFTRVIFKKANDIKEKITVFINANLYSPNSFHIIIVINFSAISMKIIINIISFIFISIKL